MKKNYRLGKKLMAATLCAAVMLSAAACSQSGNGQTEGTQAASTGESQNTEEQQEKVVFHPPAETACVTPGEKEETVYVKADATGRPTEKTVEVVLRKISSDGLLPVEDRSNLREIRNTEGDEEFFDAGSGRYLWENHGEDIKYKGKSDDALPVDVRITYYLDGQEITPQALAGKTGEVRLRFDYENHTDVPFMVLSSAIMSSEVFSDVEVTNGRVIDLGDQKMVIGAVFPGLSDSLRLADYEPTEEIDLPEYMEIGARAENFELDFTASVVSTGLFGELDDEDLEDLEDMADDMDELTDASSELSDAAGELAEGGSEFGDYLCQYFDGLSQISSGTDELDKGLGALSDNISKISEGAEALEKGLGKVDKSLSEIDLSSLTSDGDSKEAKAVQEALQSLGQNSAALGEKLSGISEASEQLQTFAESFAAYCEKADALAAAVDENPAPVLSDNREQYVNSLNEEASAQANAVIAEKAEAAAEEAVSEAAEGAAKATADDARTAVRDAIEGSGALDGLELSDEEIAAVKEQLISEICDSIEENTGDGTEINVEPEEVGISLGEALDGILAEVQTDLDDRYSSILAARNELPEPEIPDLTVFSEEEAAEISQLLTDMKTSLGVVAQYAKGMGSVTEALGDLAAGLTELKGGISKLSKGSKELTKGIGLFEKALGQAAGGSSKLSEALSQVSSAGSELGGAYWQLVDGMEAFADGVAEFDEEGIQSLAELTGPEYMEVIRGVRAAREAERGYTNFSGICDGQKGSVKFIIETEEIRTDD